MIRSLDDVYLCFVGCTMPECDMQYGALSMCAPGDEPCPAVHDEVPEINICTKRGMRCCRSICNGTGTMCMPNGNPCPSGFKTVKGICPWAVDDQYQCCSPLAGIKVEETPKNHNS